MSSSAAISVRAVSKVYRTYRRPSDRLKQAALSRVHGVTRRLGGRWSPPEYFNEFWALKNVSFEVHAGQCLGILGRNGAGKSTLLQVIAGTVVPTAGEVSARGRIAALLELGSGFNSDFTGRENVFLSAALLGLGRRETEEKLPLIEEFAEIGDFIDQPIKIYSSGLVLRLAFSVYVAMDPLIMIVDEALAVGDARFQRKCYQRLDAFRKNGGTILFVTHDMGVVPQICDRAMILERGEVYAEGSPLRIAREYHRLLFGPPSSDDRQQRPRTEAAARNLLPARPDAGDAHEVRYGSREAVITNVVIRAVGQQVVGALELNEDYDVVMTVTYASAIEGRINYGFMISNVQGIEIYATKSSMFGRSLPPGPAGSNVECVLRLRMSLMPGAYFLSCAVARAEVEQANEFLDYRFDMMQFEVVGQARCFNTSVVDLRAQLFDNAVETATTR
jgi:lipopolysaccharide transport system ATP-binding protein